MGWGDFWQAAADWAITWIPVLGPLGILVTALVAYFAYRQKLEADRRAQWWVRAQWALEASLSANPRRSLAGLAVLNDLKTSSLATREDRELFRLIAVTAQEELLGPAAGPGSGSGLGSGLGPGAGLDGPGSAGERGVPGGGPAVRSVRRDQDSLLEAALRAQLEQLAGDRSAPSAFLPGSSAAPTVGESQNH
ncbi:hypothetical protein ACWGQ2_02150 [Arthrobacter sp. NPDC055585]